MYVCMYVRMYVCMVSTYWYSKSEDQPVKVANPLRLKMHGLLFLVMMLR